MENTSVFFGEKLLTAEAESGLFDLAINGEYVWQYARYRCLLKIIEEVTGVVMSRKVSIPQNKEGRKSLREWLKYCQFLVHKKDILVLNHPRRIKEGSYYRCVVTDRILENLDYSYYVYEAAYFGRHYKPVTTKHLKYIDLDIIRKIFKYDEEKNGKELAAFARKVIASFEKSCQIVLSKELKKSIFLDIVHVHKELFYHKIWARIVLALIRPKLVMVTVGYGFLVQVMVAEAKRKHIPTVELQHGRIGETHLAYNYIYRGELESFADYMFVYGNYEKVTARFPIADDHVIAVGCPEWEKKVRYYAKHKKSNRKKVIVFLSALGTGDIISKYALEMRKSPKLKNYRMIYKLHPAEYNDWKSWYPELKDSGLEIIEDNLHDIYYYLGHSDYVVGISSTVLFEATGFNTQIFVVKDGDYRKAEYLYRNDHARLVENVEQLIDEIEHPARKKQAEEENKYFKMNSIQNIQREIKRII